MLIKQLLKALLWGFVSLTLINCGPDKGFESKDYSAGVDDDEAPKKPTTTGYTKVVQPKNTNEVPRVIKYTPSGNLDAFDRLAADERSSIKHSNSFAQQIDWAQIALKTLNKANNQFSIKIKLEKLKTLLEFEYSVHSDNLLKKKISYLKAHSDDGFDYRISSYCDDINCSVLSLTLYQLKGTDLTAQASFLYTVIKTKVRAQVADGKKDNADQNAFVGNLLKATDAVKETIAVVDGKSNSTVKIISSADPNVSLLQANTPVIKTGESPIDANQVQVQDKNTQVVASKLQGSNAQTGGLALDVTLANQKQKTRLRFYIAGDEEDSDIFSDFELQKLLGDALANYNSPLFPLTSENVSQMDVPKTMVTTAKLEVYRKHKITKKYIDMWTKKKASRLGFCEGKKSKTYYTPRRANRFLKQMSSKVKNSEGKTTTLGKLTSSILNKVDVMPQLAYLAAIEGTYWDNFEANEVVPYQKNSGKYAKYRSDASGPYACLTDTCRETIRNNKTRLEEVGLGYIQVSYVTAMEREIYQRKLKEGIPDRQIRRGNIRSEIYKAGKEEEYIEQRGGLEHGPKRILVKSDARAYFATATLLAGLVLRPMLFENKLVEQKDPNLPQVKATQKYLRKDPALAILAYHAGNVNLATYTICSELETEVERTACREKYAKMSGRKKAKEMANLRHKGFDTSLEDITKFEMAPCNQLDYTWAWLALQFIGSNPSEFGIEVETPVDDLAFEDMVPDGAGLSYIWTDSEEAIL